MYLRATDKATGVKNFHRAVGNRLIRRELAATALQQKLSPRNGLNAVHFQYAKSLEKPLVVGVLGAGQQGRRLLAAVNKDYIQVRAIADPRPSCQELALDSLLRFYADKGWKKPAEVKQAVQVYDSYEKLLAAAKADGIEAVIIALPSHQHAKAALAALDAGLHVLVETPMALTVADAKAVARKAADKKLCLAIGQQRRYNWIYDHALAMLGKDLLDQVHYVRSQWHLPKPEKSADDAKKYKLDWWQDIPKEDLAVKYDGDADPKEVIHWQLHEKYSGGLLAELGSQLFDAAAMFMAATPNRDPQRPYPLSVAGAGSQTLKAAEGDIDDHVHCIFEYAIAGYVDAKEVPPKARKKIALQFDMIIGSPFDGYGETVLGRKGSLVLENEQKPMLFHTSDVDKSLRVTQKKDSKGAPVGPPLLDVPKDGKADEDSESYGELLLQRADAGFAAELEHWACCCKPVADAKGGKPRCDAQAGLYTTVLTVAATKAVQHRSRVDFKDEWFDIKSDATPDDL